MFSLHERLAEDTLELLSWPLNRVLLMNDRTYPWLILVPQREDLRDLHDLPASDHLVLMDEIARASRALQAVYSPVKLNVAALGNMVPQLHIHVIARFETDPAWPGPVWGKTPVQPYAAEETATTVASLRAALERA